METNDTNETFFFQPAFSMSCKSIQGLAQAGSRKSVAFRRKNPRSTSLW